MVSKFPYMVRFMVNKCAYMVRFMVNKFPYMVRLMVEKIVESFFHRYRIQTIYIPTPDNPTTLSRCEGNFMF